MSRVMSHESACRLRPGEQPVSWDFETDPELQQEIEARFAGVRDEVER